MSGLRPLSALFFFFYKDCRAKAPILKMGLFLRRKRKDNQTCYNLAAGILFEARQDSVEKSYCSRQPELKNPAVLVFSEKSLHQGLASKSFSFVTFLKK
jgi:hypothetical protein